MEIRKIPDREVFGVLLALCRERLTIKQKKALEILRNNEEPITATRTAFVLSQEIPCSRSTSWNILNTLRKTGLIIFGSAKKKGKPVRFSEIGKMVCEEMEVVK